MTWGRMMNVPSPFLFVLTLLIGVAPANSAQAQSGAEPRTALIIGNSAYTSGKLANPINDATDIANALRGDGFDVTLETDSDQQGMQEAVRAFGLSLKQKGGVGLFYFAGHGMQVSGENYLLPLMQGSMTDPQTQAVSALEVVDTMAAAHSGLNIVVLDACRNNPLILGGTHGLSRIDTNASLFVSYSTSPGAFALDGDGRNSPYTKHLVTALTQADLSIEETFKRTLKGVYQETHGLQTPWISSSFFGNFIFQPSRHAVGPVTEPTAPKFTGVYRVEGSNPSGSRYRGMLTLTAFGKDYLLKWWIGRQVLTGSGQLAGRMLVVNWGQKSPVVYTIKQDSVLDGEWADGTATERLDLYARAADDLVSEPSGQYRVSGHRPDGQTYSGTVSVVNRSGQYAVDWRIGGGSYHGNGTLSSNILTVDWGNSSTAVYALNSNGTLSGLWNSGEGEETWAPDR
jgi:hypothetical protein